MKLPRVSSYQYDIIGRQISTEQLRLLEGRQPQRNDHVYFVFNPDRKPDEEEVAWHCYVSCVRNGFKLRRICLS